MSKNVAKRALLGFAAGALQGASQFLQTRAAQEAERLREERLAAIRAEERREDRAFQEKRDADQRTFNLDLMSRQETAQAARDQRQLEARKEELKLSGENQIRYANAITANRSAESGGEAIVPRFLIEHSDGRQEVIEGSTIPAGAKAIGNVRRDGTLVPIPGVARAAAATNPAAAPPGRQPRQETLGNTGLRVFSPNQIPEGSTAAGRWDPHNGGFQPFDPEDPERIFR